MKHAVTAIASGLIALIAACSPQVRLSPDELKKELGLVEGGRYVNRSAGIAFALPAGASVQKDWPIDGQDTKIEGPYFRSARPDWYDYYFSLGMTLAGKDTLNIKVLRATDGHLRRRTRNMALSDNDAMVMIRTPLAYMLRTLGVKGDPAVPYRVQVINGVKFHTMAIQFAATDRATNRKIVLAVYSLAAARGRYWVVIDEYRTMKDFFGSEKALMENRDLHAYRMLRSLKPR